MEISKQKILIVDDEPANRKLIATILTYGGHPFEIAENGREALAKMACEDFALILLDIIMPIMDGYETLKTIREDPRLNHILVALVTALPDRDARLKGLALGANDFLTKPIDSAELEIRVKNLLKIQEFQALLKGHNEILTKQLKEIRRLNEELMRARDELCMINEELETRVQERTTALSQEIAERKRAEVELQNKNSEIKTILQQLWQAAKLATMGELASSIAHELNNPLATVSLRIESLTIQTPNDDKRRRELEIIGHEVERMGNLITNLLQFSRRSQQQISTVDVPAEIKKTYELIEYHLRKNNIKVIWEFAPNMPCIHADRQQLRQLFLNLFTNASDAMPQGGTLTVRVAALPKEKQLVIEIADTGVGIPPRVLPKVMEAFFTTKPEGKGTGLGLAICRRIAQEHGGTLDIMSEGIPGKGTRVRIALPLSNGSNSKSFMNE